MEWLSHSQKKYCELCKTSFRFTKLYAPDMPQSLPVHIFIGHMARYFFQNVLVWLRAALAISVWLCWLPYFMRGIWSVMFWVSDEGFGSTSMMTRSNDTASSTANSLRGMSPSALDFEACPGSPLFVATTTPASVANTLLDGLSEQNISDFFARMMSIWGVAVKSDRPESTNATSSPSMPIPPTLLGEVAT